MVAGRFVDLSRILRKLSKNGVLSRVQIMSGNGVRMIGRTGTSSGYKIEPNEKQMVKMLH